jgi:CubicO group peptidase (beta-lactamase class C family)
MSGPDFDRAARHWQQTWPAGSHFEASPVNAQVLAMVAARLSDMSYADVLQRLWSRMAAEDATALMDHRRGNIAAHCCIHAAATDWLRLGLLLADDGKVGSRQILPAGFLHQVMADSPVHPGYGLGFRITDNPAAGRLLELQAPGRMLLIAPALRQALFWVGSGAPPSELHRLLGAETASP